MEYLLEHFFGWVNKWILATVYLRVTWLMERLNKMQIPQGHKLGIFIFLFPQCLVLIPIHNSYSKYLDEKQQVLNYTWKKSLAPVPSIWLVLGTAVHWYLRSLNGSLRHSYIPKAVFSIYHVPRNCARCSGNSDEQKKVWSLSSWGFWSTESEVMPIDEKFQLIMKTYKLNSQYREGSTRRQGTERQVEPDLSGPSSQVKHVDLVLWAKECRLRQSESDISQLYLQSITLSIGRRMDGRGDISHRISGLLLQSTGTAQAHHQITLCSFPLKP